TSQHAKLTITGKNFGDASDNVVVFFQVGGVDVANTSGTVQVGGKDVQAQATVISDTKVELTVPNTVALGTAQISVIRDVHNLGTDIRQSNVVHVPVASGYTLATQRITGQLAVFDNRPTVPDPSNPGLTISNANFNNTIANIPVTGGFPQYVATTPDNTRAYVTTLGGIAVVDTVAMQEVGHISLTGNPNPVPFHIVVDHAGGFAYVTDWVSAMVYIVDVDPNSDDYNKCVGTVQNVMPVNHGLRGLDV